MATRHSTYLASDLGDRASFYFDFAASLARAQSVFLCDNPARTGEPRFAPERPDFDSYPSAVQLSALEHASRREFYRAAIAESITEGEGAEEITQALANSAITDAQLGALMRLNALQYAQACAELRGDDMRDFL